MPLAPNIIEAANRAEATALLLRAGFLIYRPEADVDGEDLVIKRPNNTLVPVQLKGAPYVDVNRYGGRGIWMLFPNRAYDGGPRIWYLVPHDHLYSEYALLRHGHAAGWNGSWRWPYAGQALSAFLAPFSHPNW